MSNFPCSLTRNITSHSMENLAFRSLLWWRRIILPILTTSLIHFSLGGWENVHSDLTQRWQWHRPLVFKELANCWVLRGISCGVTSTYVVVYSNCKKLFSSICPVHVMRSPNTSRASWSQQPSGKEIMSGRRTGKCKKKGRKKATNMMTRMLS